MGTTEQVEEVLHSGFDLQLRVRRSNDLDKILPALIKAQQEFDTVSKDMENQAYKRGNSYSKYATLDSVISATLPHLNKNGLTIVQHLQSDNKSRELIITTSLYHQSGQFFESDLTMPSIGANNRFDPQTVASASTYGRRVAWLAIVGAAPSDDDDGNQASGVGTKEGAKAAGEAKIDEFLKKNPPAATAALFFTWFEESKTAQISGDKQLITAQRDLLKKHWNPTVQAIVVDAETLENLKFQFGERNVPFKQLKEPHASRA